MRISDDLAYAGWMILVGIGLVAFGSVMLLAVSDWPARAGHAIAQALKVRRQRPKQRRRPRRRMPKKEYVGHHRPECFELAA